MRQNWKEGENSDRRRNRTLNALLPMESLGFKEEIQLSGWFCFFRANRNTGSICGWSGNLPMIQLQELQLQAVNRAKETNDPWVQVYFCPNHFRWVQTKENNYFLSWKELRSNPGIRVPYVLRSLKNNQQHVYGVEATKGDDLCVF